jgi:Rod binding domain-containing protein
MDALAQSQLAAFAVRAAGIGARENPVPKTAPQIAAAAQDFEAVFIAQMFEQMWAEVPTDGPFGGGTGERVFRSLMIQDIGRQIARQGGIGLADAVKRELIALQARAK